MVPVEERMGGLWEIVQCAVTLQTLHSVCWLE